ncbi:MAG: DUF2017 family protein [bacterium]|nr:DUF2017 family protein [bacterium]
MRKFVWHDGVITARLDEFDLALLSAVPPLITGVGDVGVDPAASRLEPAVHREDAERSAEFLRLSSSLIDEGRAADLAVFEESLQRAADDDSLTAAEAESWIRVLSSARLILGARLGIADNDWEDGEAVDRHDPRALALYVLGMLQEDLVSALSTIF